MTYDLDRMKQLAGIKREIAPAKLVVLLPENPTEQIRDLLDRLKAIAEESGTDWTVIDIDGQPYRATGVKRDL